MHQSSPTTPDRGETSGSCDVTVNAHEVNTDSSLQTTDESGVLDEETKSPQS